MPKTALWDIVFICLVSFSLPVLLWQWRAKWVLVWDKNCVLGIYKAGHAVLVWDKNRVLGIYMCDTMFMTITNPSEDVAASVQSMQSSPAEEHTPLKKRKKKRIRASSTIP